MKLKPASIEKLREEAQYCWMKMGRSRIYWLKKDNRRYVPVCGSQLRCFPCQWKYNSKCCVECDDQAKDCEDEWGGNDWRRDEFVRRVKRWRGTEAFEEIELRHIYPVASQFTGEGGRWCRREPVAWSRIVSGRARSFMEETARLPLRERM